MKHTLISSFETTYAFVRLPCFITCKWL